MTYIVYWLFLWFFAINVYCLKIFAKVTKDLPRRSLKHMIYTAEINIPKQSSRVSHYKFDTMLMTKITNDNLFIVHYIC